MKKILALVLAALMAVSLFTACAAKTETAAPAPTGAETPASEAAEAPAGEDSPEGLSYTVGICNYVDDASLNQIVENIQTRLAAIGEEKGVTFNVEYDNCNADSNLMSQII